MKKQNMFVQNIEIGLSLKEVVENDSKGKNLSMEKKTFDRVVRNTANDPKQKL